MSDFDPAYKGDNDWLLGVAKTRAQQILNLASLYEDGRRQVGPILDAIREQAQAILDDKP